MNYDQSSLEILTNQLKREIKELKEQNEHLSSANEKLSNIDFSYKLALEEKKLLEKEISSKNDANIKIISQLRSEVELLTKRLTEEETKNKLLAHEIEQLSSELLRSEDSRNKLSQALLELEENLNSLGLENKK